MPFQDRFVIGPVVLSPRCTWWKFGTEGVGHTRGVRKMQCTVAFWEVTADLVRRLHPDSCTGVDSTITMYNDRRLGCSPGLLEHAYLLYISRETNTHRPVGGGGFLCRCPFFYFFFLLFADSHMISNAHCETCSRLRCLNAYNGSSSDQDLE